MNIFALYPKTISFLKQNLEIFKKEHENDRRAECLLPNEITRLIQEEKIKLKIYPADDETMGITCPEDEETVREKLKKENIL